jgi:hypothetical protein
LEATEESLGDYLHQIEDETQVSAAASAHVKASYHHQQHLSPNPLHITTTRNPVILDFSRHLLPEPRTFPTAS